MRQKIFVLVASGGEYDSAWERNVVAFTSSDVADKALAVLEEQRDRLQKIIPEISDVFYKILQQRPELEQTSPAPSPPSKAKVGSAAYEAYIAASKEWRQKNEPVMKRNEVRQAEHFQSAALAARRKAEELGCTDIDLAALGLTDDQYPDLDMDVSYNIEELELR